MSIETSGVGLPLLELLRFKHGRSYGARTYSAKSSTPNNGKNFRLKIGPIESNKHHIQRILAPLTCHAYVEGDWRKFGIFSFSMVAIR